jgi:hypothetical protein
VIRRELPPAQLLDAAGRPDLASKYRWREGIRYSVGLAGVVAVLTGAGLLTAGYKRSGLISIGAGAGSLLTAAVLPTAVSADEARAAVDEYNLRLIEHLGLPPGTETPKVEPIPGPHLQLFLTPTVGGGVMLAGTL